MNKRKKLRYIIILCTICILLLPIYVYANNSDKNPSQIDIKRDKNEQDLLRKIYKELFPEQYSYIEQYEKSGIIEMDFDKIEVIFNDTKTYNNHTYNLIVYNNGQIFTNIIKRIQDSTPILYAYDTKQVTESFQLGDIGHYNTITVTYTAQYQGNDWINSYSTGGYGFYLYPQCRRYKQYEDSSGNAYIGYHNVSMNYDGSGILYDIGVSVGDDRAIGITKLSTGLDSFLTYLLNPFLFGD